MARRPAWRSRWLNRRGSAPAAEIDPRLGAGARPPLVRSSGSGQSGTAGITGRMSLAEIIAAAGWGPATCTHKSAIAVSGIRARSAASCEPDGSCQHGSIRCRVWAIRPLSPSTPRCAQMIHFCVIANISATRPGAAEHTTATWASAADCGSSCSRIARAPACESTGARPRR
jgi:hypothetical protein